MVWHSRHIFFTEARTFIEWTNYELNAERLSNELLLCAFTVKLLSKYTKSSETKFMMIVNELEMPIRLLELFQFRLVSMRIERISRDVLLGTLSEFAMMQVENRQTGNVQNRKVIRAFVRS